MVYVTYTIDSDMENLAYVTRGGATAIVALVACALSACGGEDSNPAPGGVGPVLGDPIAVTASEQWVWVPIEGTACADGSEAGVGVNFTTQSRDLVVWFQGNGVCYNQLSCSLFENLLTGMGADPLNHLWWGDPNTHKLGIFDRNDPTNPFRASNFIAFPHCGVDGHTADKESSYPPNATVQQRGYANVRTALPRIFSTFKDATRVVVAGFSAGGIGAGANYHQIATGFEALRMPPPFLIVDAGPVLPPPYSGPLATASLHDGWGLDRTIDTWCSTCASEGYHTGYREVARMHPGLRSAIVSSYADNVATPLYGLLNAGPFDGVRFEAGLRELSAWTASYQDAVSPSVQREFYYGGVRHGALVVAPLAATPGLADFLNDQLSGSATWTTVKP